MAHLNAEMIEWICDVNSHHYIDEVTVHDCDYGQVVTIHYDGDQVMNTIYPFASQQ